MIFSLCFFIKLNNFTFLENSGHILCWYQGILRVGGPLDYWRRNIGWLSLRSSALSNWRHLGCCRCKSCYWRLFWCLRSPIIKKQKIINIDLLYLNFRSHEILVKIQEYRKSISRNYINIPHPDWRWHIIDWWHIGGFFLIWWGYSIQYLMTNIFDISSIQILHKLIPPMFMLRLAVMPIFYFKPRIFHDENIINLNENQIITKRMWKLTSLQTMKNKGPGKFQR